MSRLDSFIRRMSAQRDILNAVAGHIDDIPGSILEFGLGGGRTYDHLRERFPRRRILVFERVLIDNPLSRPAAADLVMGEIRETAARFPDGCAALVHADIETGVAEGDVELATWLPGLIARLLAPGGYAVSGSAIPDARLTQLPPPPGIDADRYHVARRVGRSA